MRKRDFTQALARMQNIGRNKFASLYQDHHDADRDYIAFQQSPVLFYLKAERDLQERLWALVRG